jgi:hypothetical protein
MGHDSERAAMIYQHEARGARRGQGHHRRHRQARTARTTTRTTA